MRGITWAGGVEFKVEADVGAGGAVLVDFHGDNIFALMEQADRDVVLLMEDGFICSTCAIGGKRGVGDGTGGRHAIAPNFSAVEINDGSVIPAQSELEPGDVRCVVNGEGFSEVSGDEFVAYISAEADLGSFRSAGTIAVAELGLAGGPCRVVKSNGLPGRPLIGTIVEIRPCRFFRD